MKIGKELGAIFGIAVLLATGVSLAAGPRAVRKQVEASMLVTGGIEVDAQGKVTGFSLDEKEKLPAGVAEMLGKAVPTWRFEPVLVAGQPAGVTTDMSVRLVAKKLEDGNYTIAIRSAGFGDRAGRHARKTVLKPEPKGGKEECPSMRPPNYPEVAVRSGVASNVYLLLKTGRDGRVIDVIAEQVNLKVVSDERSMERWRRIFTDVSLAQARKWCFQPFNKDATEDGADFRVMRVPVTFHLDSLPRYGQWEAYVPGPRQANPFQKDEEGVGFSPDTLIPDRVYFAGSGLKLLSGLSGS
jgi:hypothetical protein